MNELETIWKDDKLNVGEKVGDTIILPLVHLSEKIYFRHRDKIDRIVEADEKLKQEHPVRWATKKLAIGTLKGIFGAYTK